MADKSSQDILNDIAKSIPLGVHYYIIDPQYRAIDGPWGREEITRRFATCTVEGAAIAYWSGQKWVTHLHYYSSVDKGEPMVPVELKNDLGNGRKA